VDVLINNAGFGLYGPVEEIGIDEARYQFEVNLFGAARLTQLLLPAMRARRSGHIVNISSMGGKMYSILGAWYHATKHALEGWSDCLRLEVAGFGIKVTIVEPGVIETGFGDAASESIVKRSHSGPYGQLVKMVAASIKKLTGTGQAAIRRLSRMSFQAPLTVRIHVRAMPRVSLQKCLSVCASGWATVYSTVLFSVRHANKRMI
jgi:short-subunit dehydrogenase